MILDKIKQLTKQSIKNVDRMAFLLIAVFVISRIILVLSGFKIDMRFLETAWQTLDTYYLQHDLLNSIWMLHSQPPLYNFFIGIGLKLAPVNNALLFQLTHHVLGLVATLGIYSITKHLTKNKNLSAIISILFVLSPAFILYEGLFFYDFPVAILLIITAWIFQKFVSTNKTSYLVAFFAMAALMVLTRRVFHLLWFLFFAGFMFYYYKHEWKRILLACSIPFLILMFWQGKNLFYFGTFDMSSWGGLGFFKTATYSLTEDERRELFESGVTTENIFFGDDPFRIPLDLSSEDQFNERAIAHPTVSELKKKNNTLNYNHYGYIDLSRKLKKEFVSIIKNKPSAYLKGSVVTSIIYFAPSSNYFAPSRESSIVELNYGIIQKWDNLYNRFIYGQPLAWSPNKLKNYLTNKFQIKPTESWRLLSPGLLLILLYGFTIIYSIKSTFQKNAVKKLGRSEHLTILFLLLNILYISTVGILAEAGENQRHRFTSEAFVWILFAIVIQDLILNKYLNKRYEK
jgi:hypothetical protein